jgi:mitogen-activated protein kinase 15
MSDEIEPHILERYEILNKLGKGAYGIVWRSVEKKTGRVVALKKIYDAFSNSKDAQRTYREVMFLLKFRGHENVVELLHAYKAENGVDLYLVFEYLGWPHLFFSVFFII